MKRVVKPELLDGLPPDDPLAVGSRNDLRRVNAWMRHHAIMASALQSQRNGRGLEQITELGAGDGDFLLQVAHRLASFDVPPSGGSGSERRPDRLKPGHQTANANVILLDRQEIVTPQTLAAFTALGWRAEAIKADVFDWSHAGSPADIVIANLFLHHFYDISLAGMFRAIAARARLFIALEPRRTPLPWLCSRLLWAIGCNRVTRHDAAVSVQAGFLGQELSALWPDRQNWQLTERFAGNFSHLFIAHKKPGAG